MTETGSLPGPAPAQPTLLRVDGRPARDGRLVVEASRVRPRLSWAVAPSADTPDQLGWEVELVPDGAPGAPVVLRGDGPDPWTFTPPLESYARHSWRVRVRGAQGWSAWSAPSTLETGPLTLDEWSGGWVAQPALETRRAVLAWDGAVDRARVRVAAQGLVRVELNGVAVDSGATDPSRTDPVRALYRAYDVADLVRQGANELDVTLAPGAWGASGEDPRVLAELVVEGDGRRIASGPHEAHAAWASEVTASEPFYLERHEPGPRTVREIPPPPALEALTAGDDPHATAHPPVAVSADAAPPIRDVRPIVPRLLTRAGGVAVYDVGTNIAGRVHLVVRGATGGELRLVHGEHLDAAGRVDTTNLTMPFDRGRVRQAVEYVLADAPEQRLEPWFAYHGFRYVEVSGIPDGVELEPTAWTHHSDLETVTTLDTGSDLIDRLLTRAERTLLNNVHGIPEDCPTREQAGWTGDTASVAEMELSLFDMEAFLRKWIGDLLTSQRPDGAIPAVAPHVGATDFAPDPVWGSALQRVLVGHWLHYGDTNVVADALPGLRRWVDWQLAHRGPDGVVSEAPISYGHDWLSLEQTPPEVHHTGAAIDALEVLAELEEAVGEPSEAPRRRGEAEELRRSARARFLDPGTGTIASGSQGSIAVALESGLVDADHADAAMDALVADVRARGNRVSSGFAATRTVVRALARAGRGQVLMDCLAQPEEPGVGAMLVHGPGTFWENWWIDPYNTGTGSLDHVGLGGPFAGWALQWLAGVRPTGPGFARVDVAPTFVAGVDRIDLRTRTVRGELALRATRAGSEADVELTVPVGAVARLISADGSAEELPTGVHRRRIAVAPAEAPALSSAAGSWRAPSVARSAADVRDGGEWLADAVANGRLRIERGRPETHEDGIVCMPVPHAQVTGPVVRVTGDAAEPPAARVELDGADLGAARFAYALLDLCLPQPPRRMEAVLTLHGADGTSVRGIGRIWPAGWNRVTVDLGDWPGRERVVAAEVSLRFPDPAPDGLDEPVPASFHVGRVGWSAARRTW